MAWIGMTANNTSCVDGVVRKPQLNCGAAAAVSGCHELECARCVVVTRPDLLGQFNEYEFQWLECTDGAVYFSAHSNLPVLMLRTLVRDQKFLEEIEKEKLMESQMGRIHLPFHMKSDDPNHQNPTLFSIFDASIPRVAIAILVVVGGGVEAQGIGWL
ncbi:hypothetical protein B0H14DRAFT_2640479 [Mycena olivaceomarginata]|nr:hypothetical protein B0H14DRAFT_2640479 [Mycena olivaceomarginata]